MSGPKGTLITAILNLDFALDRRFNITLDDVSQEEFNGLKLLVNERNRQDQEKHHR